MLASFGRNDRDFHHLSGSAICLSSDFSIENWRISGAHPVACFVYIELLRSAGSITHRDQSRRTALMYKNQSWALRWMQGSCIDLGRNVQWQKECNVPVYLRSTFEMVGSFSMQGAFACLHLAGGWVWCCADWGQVTKWGIRIAVCPEAGITLAKISYNGRDTIWDINFSVC